MNGNWKKLVLLIGVAAASTIITINPATAPLINRFIQEFSPVNGNAPLPPSKPFGRESEYFRIRKHETEQLDGEFKQSPDFFFKKSLPAENLPVWQL